MSSAADDEFTVTPRADNASREPKPTGKIIHLPVGDNRTLAEIRAAERRAGWLEGYQASERDQVQRKLMKPEMADEIIVGRFAQILALVREVEAERSEQVEEINWTER